MIQEQNVLPIEPLVNPLGVTHRSAFN